MANEKKAKITSFIRHLDVYVSSVALVILILITFLGVIARYVIGSPFGWTEEMQAFLIVWVVFAAAGAAFRTGNHSAIDVVYTSVPKKVQKVLNVFITIVSMIVFGYLAYTSVLYLQLFIRTGRKTSVLQISYVFIYSIVFISCFLQALNFIMVNVLGKWNESVNLVEENKLTDSEQVGAETKEELQ